MVLVALCVIYMGLWHCVVLVVGEEERPSTQPNPSLVTLTVPVLLGASLHRVPAPCGGTVACMKTLYADIPALMRMAL
jgi:hypothetical protein